MRLGIATGLAVVGDLIGEGAAQERGVIGETPNLAARLQALAAPNTLIIAEMTRRLVGGCSTWKTSDRNSLPALPSSNALGACWAKAGK